MHLLHAIHGMPLKFDLEHVENLQELNKFIHKLAFIVACQQFIDNVVLIMPQLDFGQGEETFEFSLGCSLFDDPRECQIQMYQEMEDCISKQIQIQESYPIPGSQNFEASLLEYIVTVLHERQAYYKMKRVQLNN